MHTDVYRKELIYNTITVTWSVIHWALSSLVGQGIIDYTGTETFAKETKLTKL